MNITGLVSRDFRALKIALYVVAITRTCSGYNSQKVVAITRSFNFNDLIHRIKGGFFLKSSGYNSQLRLKVVAITRSLRQGSGYNSQFSTLF